MKEQLAGLLISRQIIGNLRESAFPYFMEQLKLAKLSFSMWGALSPTQESSKLSELPVPPPTLTPLLSNATSKLTLSNETEVKRIFVISNYYYYLFYFYISFSEK